MSAEDFRPEPQPKNLNIMAIAGVAVVMFGAGMGLESYLAGQTAASVKLAHEQELNQAAGKAQVEKQMLTDELAKERDTHDKDIQSKDKNLVAFANRAAGVRHALEADLSAARSSGDACTGRIARIAEALGGVFDSVGEVAGIAQDLGRENEQLKADNQSLSQKLAGWQKWNAERMQRVTVIGHKNG